MNFGNLAELMHRELSLKDDSMHKKAEIARAMEKIALAADLFEDCGLIKEAEIITDIMTKIAREKPGKDNV